MGHIQSALNRKTRLGREHVPVRGLQIIDEDFVEEESARIDEVSVQEFGQLSGEASD